MTLAAIMNTYGRLPVSFTHGEGCYLFDENGNQYLDAISGIGVNALGHAHPTVTEAIQQQSTQLLHTSNLYGISLQQQLADALVNVSGMDNVFFSNSGAEANEAAIKIARLYGHKNGIEVPHIVVLDNAFHGRTMATLTASGNRKIQAGFEPLLTGFVRAPYGDIDDIHTIAKNNANIVAVLVEPIQGEGGVNLLPERYLWELRQLCDDHNWLMMLDEVQTGNGRTGKYFAYQHENIIPDVVTTAKGLGNGVPIGACLAKGKAATVFGPGNHGSTYGGNPLACAAAKAVVGTITNDKLCENAATMGQLILSTLQKALSSLDYVTEVRGLGLMIGIELNSDCGALVNEARDKGLLINVTAGNVIRLLPPLIIDDNQARTLTDTVIELVQNWNEK